MLLHIHVYFQTIYNYTTFNYFKLFSLIYYFVLMIIYNMCNYNFLSAGTKLGERTHVRTSESMHTGMTFSRPNTQRTLWSLISVKTLLCSGSTVVE